MGNNLYALSVRESIWLTFFFIFSYLLLTERNFLPLLSYAASYIKSLVVSAVTLISIHPNSPLVKYKDRKKSEELAKELAKELNLYDDEDWFK